MKLLKSVVFVCLFLAGMINLQSCVENYEKVANKLVKFDKVLKLYTYLDEPFNKTYLLDYSTVTAFAKFLG